MKKRKCTKERKHYRQIVSLTRQQLSTAMTSLLLAFLVIVGFMVGGIYTAYASNNITPDFIENGQSDEITTEIITSEVNTSDTEKSDEEFVQIDAGKEPVSVPDAVFIDSMQILQNPELPNGCEITTLTCALVSCGYPADKLLLADEYLPKSDSYWGADPEKVYMGNPRHSSKNPGGYTQGWYCYEGPILEAANKYLAEQSSIFRARAENLERDALLDKLANGVPVIAWITTNVAGPKHSSSVGWYDDAGQWFIPYVNVHCVLVVGYNLSLSEVGLMDPLSGFKTVSIDTFFSVYEQMGSRSITIE